MKRVGVVGNSHAGCLWLAGKPASLDVSFVVAPGRYAPSMVKTSAGYRLSDPPLGVDGVVSTLDPDAFDCIVVFGLGDLAARSALVTGGEHLLGSARLHHWPGTTSPITSGMMRTVIRQNMQRTGAWRFLADLTRTYAQLVLVVANPHPAQAVIPTDWGPSEALADPHVAWSEYLELCDQELSALVAGLPGRVRLVDRIESAPFAEDAYGRDGDPWHMNAVYGAALMSRLERLINDA